MNNKKYIAFDNYIIRTPLLSIESENCYNSCVEKKYFNEAIYLSSPELFGEVLKSRKKDGVINLRNIITAI